MWDVVIAKSIEFVHTAKLGALKATAALAGAEGLSLHVFRQTKNFYDYIILLNIVYRKLCLQNCKLKYFDIFGNLGINIQLFS